MNERSSVDKALALFVVISGVGAWLWMKGPAANQAQFLFRVGVSVVGLIGLIAVGVVKAKQR